MIKAIHSTDFLAIAKQYEDICRFFAAYQDKPLVAIKLIKSKDWRDTAIYIKSITASYNPAPSMEV